MSDVPNWRVAPTPGQKIAVERIARREDRSIANTLRQLISEALRHRGEAPRQLPSDQAPQ
jgi:hypothetical protein